MTYTEAIQYLSQLQKFGARFGLEATQQLAAAGGNPQARLRFIHVAGTNGKGSTCAMLESIYRAAGLRVGLFTSPHLVSFRERIQVNRTLISESAVARLTAELITHQGPAELTFFEFVTVLALHHFAAEQCELVIWETGLGGRLDATNIVTPLASVITNIGLDHEAWLGDTLAKIAGEKAGIIKPGVPVVTAAEDPEALNVLRGQAAQLGAPLTVVNLAPAERDASSLPLPLAGVHQKVNAALARATVTVLQDRIPVTESQIQRGLGTVDWPGRLQIVTQADGRRLLLDGAHNPAGGAVLRQTVRDGLAGFPGSPACTTLILGTMEDKNWTAMCAILAPLAHRILLVALATDRTASPEDLARACRQANPQAEVRVQASVAAALAKAARDPYVIVTGSLYLVGETLGLLSPTEGGAGDERGLNHWQAPRRQV